MLKLLIDYNVKRMKRMNDHSINYQGIEIYKKAKLSHYTFTHTGGNADYLAFPKNLNQTKILLSFAKKNHLQITVLGNASNLIIRDGGIHGLVIILQKMASLKVVGSQITAGAGVPIIDVAVTAQQHSLTGLEYAAGIPGSVGGAVFMNAGAYGSSTSRVLTSAEVLTFDGQIKHLSNQDLDFSYRHSAIQDHPAIVLQATFTLKVGQKDKIQAQMDDVNAQRSAKQPLNYPSCGSVFKRPQGHFAGQLIHDSGLQGYRFGGAQDSRVHAGFIVNVDHASATDYLKVIHHIQEKVYQDSGIHLQTEVRIIGQKKD